MAGCQREELERRLSELQSQMKEIGPVMRGSVTVMGTRHKQPYFSVSIAGKTRLIYLGQERARTAGQCVANYRHLTALIDEMTLLHMRLLKATDSAKRKSEQPQSSAAEAHDPPATPQRPPP
jgi:hypothetical protein